MPTLCASVVIVKKKGYAWDKLTDQSARCTASTSAFEEQESLPPFSLIIPPKLTAQMGPDSRALRRNERTAMQSKPNRRVGPIPRKRVITEDNGEEDKAEEEEAVAEDEGGEAEEEEEEEEHADGEMEAQMADGTAQSTLPRKKTGAASDDGTHA